MLQLLFPIWLVSMAGIVIPVIIHLWNNKQGKVLRIGSIALLEKGSRRQARSSRLSEWWLLLLRCLLLLLLALLLAAPFWRISSRQEKTKGWILGTKAATRGATYKNLADSLLKAGYEWHEWSDGEYWDLFKAADLEAPATLPFYIFTSRRQIGFTGKRPVSGRIVHWFTTMPSPDSTNHWISRAWLCSPDSIRVLTGSSRLTGNIYQAQMLPVKGVSQGAYQVGFSNGRLSVALDSQAPVIVDTTPLRIGIYADSKYNNDSRYVAGALHALQQFTRQNMQVTINGSFSGPAVQASPRKGLNIASRSGWIFWLSSARLPADLPAHNIVCYEAGREIPVDTWIQGVEEVALSRLVEPDSASDGSKGSQVLWKDGFGRPLLTMETRPGRRIFHCLSHFDPAWNGLVWSPRFPILLQDLLTAPADGIGIGQGSSAGDQDLRVLDPAQIVPQKSLAGGLVTERGQPLPTIDLTPVCWILLLLIFVTERILSFRSPKIKTNG